jgi:hypothetical protein
VSRFSPEWLALRERYDIRARNRAVLDAVAQTFSKLPSVAAVDLGCGTGSTLRAITGTLPPRQSWRLLDNDLGLLAQASAMPAVAEVNVVTRPIDLARDLELAFEAPVDLVTISALLDLVSRDWLDRLMIEAAARGLPTYAALTYDGRTLIEPADAFDMEAIGCAHAHQRTNKGFGPALGPSAAVHALERFEHFGYAVVHGGSDWVLGPDDRAIQELLFAGWAELHASREPARADAAAAWLSRRRSHLLQGRSRLRVGHLDIFARPISMR